MLKLDYLLPGPLPVHERGHCYPCRSALSRLPKIHYAHISCIRVILAEINLTGGLLAAFEGDVTEISFFLVTLQMVEYWLLINSNIFALSLIPHLRFNMYDEIRTRTKYVIVVTSRKGCSDHSVSCHRRHRLVFRASILNEKLL